MHSLENFIKKIFNTLKEHHQIEHFEIYGEYNKNDILMSQLDSRGRWMGDILKDSNLHARLQCTVFLANGKYAQIEKDLREDALPGRRRDARGPRTDRAARPRPRKPDHSGD